MNEINWKSYMDYYGAPIYRLIGEIRQEIPVTEELVEGNKILLPSIFGYVEGCIEKFDGRFIGKAGEMIFTLVKSPDTWRSNCSMNMKSIEKMVINE